MHHWYRSGLEGYCKAAARVMGLPDNNSGWGNFGHDLFADGRFDDPAKASKTWTLSRFRGQGRSNRPKLFEESWLGEQGPGSELAAIHTCVHNMCSTATDSALYELYQSAPDTFAADFHREILPSMADGFMAERYHPSDIAQFSQGIDKVLSKLDPALPQTFRNFAIPLVAGVIYGPNHDAARVGTSSMTLRKPRDVDAGELPDAAVDGRAIILTQLFSDDVGLVGHTSSFGADSAILIGRATDEASYLAAFESEFGEIATEKEARFFPVPHTHKCTSKVHGLIACVDGTWYYHDLSTNGSYIANAHQPSSVHRGAVALAPGDRIYLGISEEPAEEAEAYRLATSVLVSFRVDESSFGA